MNLKKIMVLLLTLSSLSILGCKSQELSEPLTRDYQTLDGQMTSLGGIKVNKLITNVFQSDDGQVYYAYSDRYDLNDTQYLSKRIQAYGLVTTHSELDKSLFEIRRISDATEVKVETTTVENKEYSNQEIGFKLSYSNDWQLEENSSSVSFIAPIEVSSSTGSSTGEVSVSTESKDPDVVFVKVTSSKLTKNSSDQVDERADEIRDFVRVNYSNLVGVGSELSYLGVDKLFAVRYKTLTGDIYYFIPKSASLFEISFNHSSTEDKVKHTNTFFDMIASFRFIPAEGNTAEELISEEIVSEPVAEEISEEDGTDVMDDPIEIPTGFREFESTPFKFKIQYPSSWYYSGGSSGYDFSNEPIEDDSEALIRLDLSSTGTTGSASTGDTFSITSKVGERYYKLSGSTELKSTMETMSKSIQEITE